MPETDRQIDKTDKQIDTPADRQTEKLIDICANRQVDATGRCRMMGG